MACSIVIRVTAHELDSGAWRGTLVRLLPLMRGSLAPSGHPGDGLLHTGQSIADYYGVVHWDVEGSSRDDSVRRFFSGLDSVWPLWGHFTARDESLWFVASALSEGGVLTPRSIERFVSRCVDVLRDFYLVYDVAVDLQKVRCDLDQYFADRVAERDDGRYS